MDKQKLNKIMTTEMDRKQFLGYMIGVTVSLIGLSRFIEVLQRPFTSNKPVAKRESGYGSTPYGQ